MLIANSNLVPHWATWEHFHELDRKGLMMYGQMTAGAGSTSARRASCRAPTRPSARVRAQHFGGDARGRWILTGGLGGMGGAQPLAATMAGFSMLAVECDESRIDMRLRTGYLDRKATDARRGARDHRRGATRQAAGLGRTCSATPPTCVPELVRRKIMPDVVTDQTSAHDPRNGYLPRGWTMAQAGEARRSDPARVEREARASMAIHVRAMLDLQKPRARSRSTTATTSARSRRTRGVANAFDFPGFVPAYIRPLFCEGIGPFRWVALSGDPEDIYRTDAKVKELIPDDAHLHRWLDMARERITFQGLPARICWVGLKDRARLGLAFNEMVAQGRTQGAGRDRPRPSRLAARSQARTARPRR